MTPQIVSSNTYTRWFQYKVLCNALFLNKKKFSFKNQAHHYVLFAKRKTKLYFIFISIVQTLETSEIN